MKCGHVIGVESMTALLRSIVDSNGTKIKCPGAKPDGNPCEVEWDYAICK